MAAFADWPVYHADAAHSGVAVSSPATNAAPAAAWTSPTLDGADYGEPIVAGGKVIAATENDTVYAFGATTGARLWSTHLESPESASSLPCGDIDPSAGITSTPVANTAAGLVYVVAFGGGTHTLYALSLASGAVQWSKPADAPGLNALTEQQRGALVLADGYVYVPYGGLYGDCGTYRGAVIGIPASGSGATISYVVPAQDQGGIWAPPGPSVDSSGDLYVATGNSSSSSTWDEANAVIRLSPALQPLSSFAPANWEALNRSDLDLGSQSPVLLSGGTVFQAGKQGVGYVLNAATLGGVGGQVASTPLCPGAYGGTAYAAPTVYVACTSGVVAVSIAAGGTMGIAWRSAGFDAGAPILADGHIWVLDTGGSTLDELNLASGAVLHAVPVPAVERFATPSASGGLIFVGSDHSVEAFHA